MIFLQQYAKRIGLGDYLLPLVSQVHTENGTWVSSIKGDNGCSIGLTQINLCVHKHLKKEPKLYNWKWQLEYFTKKINHYYKKYNNFNRAQTHWNHPQAAISGAYKTKYYYKIQKIKKLFKLTGIKTN